jgi:hypothetical protein
MRDRAMRSLFLHQKENYPFQPSVPISFCSSRRKKTQIIHYGCILQVFGSCFGEIDNPKPQSGCHQND